MQTEILTVKEVADYLRLPEEVVLQEAAQGHLPGRKIADTWRFLKAAIDDWLRTQDSRAILLSQADVFGNDEDADKLLEIIYQERGRSEIEENIN